MSERVLTVGEVLDLLRSPHVSGPAVRRAAELLGTEPPGRPLHVSDVATSEILAIYRRRFAERALEGETRAARTGDPGVGTVHSDLGITRNDRSDIW